MFSLGCSCAVVIALLAFASAALSDVSAVEEQSVTRPSGLPTPRSIACGLAAEREGRFIARITRRSLHQLSTRSVI